MVDFSDLIRRTASTGLFADLLPERAAPPPLPRIGQETPNRPPRTANIPIYGRDKLALTGPAGRNLDASPFDGEGLGPLAQRRGQQFAVGATDAFASVPESLAIAQSTGQRRRVESYGEGADFWRQQVEDLRISMQNPDLTDEARAFLQGRMDDLMQGAASFDAEAAEPLIPANERPMFAQGDRLRDASGEFFGIPDPRDTGFWSGVAQGAGNMTGMAVSSLATTALTGPVGGLAVGGGLGSAMTSAQLYEEAIASGADQETAEHAASWGVLIGATEIIPINRALRLLPPRMRGEITNGFLRRFTDIAQGAGEEAAQEYLSQVAQNIVAQQLYDPDRGWTENAAEGALIGAILGGGMGAVGTAMQPNPPPKTINRTRNDPDRLNSPRLTPDDRASPIPNAIIDDGKAAIDRLLSQEARLDPTPIPSAQAQQIAPAMTAPAQDNLPAGAVPMSVLYGKPDPGAPVAPQTDKAPVTEAATARVAAQATNPQEPATPATEQAPVAPAGETAPATQDAPAQPLPDDVELLPEVGPDGSETGRILRVKVDKATGRGKVLADVADVAAPVEAPPRPAIEVLTNAEIPAIQTNAAVFQYKANADASGVSERLRDVTKWDSNRTGIALVYEYTDGRREVVDGHQRVGLARRLIAQGQNVDLPVLILREADGVTVAQARQIGAEKNIAEGTGTAIDAAKIFRETRQTARELNLPRDTQLVKDGDALAKLSDQAFGMVINEVASQKNGAIVGRLVEDQARHSDILGLLGRINPANATEAESIVRQAMSSEVKETQTDMFGEMEVSSNLYVERAKIMDRALKDLGAEITTFKTLGTRGEMITDAGNILQADANAARQDAATAARASLMKQANTKGAISDALTQAARAVKDGGEITTAAKQFIAAVRAADAGSQAVRPRTGNAGNSDGRPQESRPQGDVKPTYINRPVLNDDAIREWAISQGFASTVPDMHVTVIYSKTPVDQGADAFQPASGQVTVLGERTVEKLGDAVVLVLDSKALQTRNKALLDAGASSDFDGYKPHVTISYAAGDMDLSKVEPFTGPIRLGGEVVAELNENAADAIKAAEVPAPKAELAQPNDEFAANGFSVGKDTDAQFLGGSKNGRPGKWVIRKIGERFKVTRQTDQIGSVAIPSRNIGMFDDAASAIDAVRNDGAEIPARIEPAKDNRTTNSEENIQPKQRPAPSRPGKDLFDQPGAKGGVGERQTDIEDLIDEAVDRDPDTPDMFGAVEKDQAVATDTAAFMAWFGDSKVVDAEGKPLVVYHGGVSGIDSFDPEEGAKITATWFSNVEGYSEGFARRQRGEVYPVYLKMENPLIFDVAAAARSDVEAAGIDISGMTDAEIEEAYLGGRGLDEAAAEFIKQAKANGNDGVILRRTYDGYRAENDQYIAFSPTQIKSIFNNGDFNPTDPRISYQAPTSAPTVPREVLTELMPVLRALLDRMMLKNVTLAVDTSGKDRQGAFTSDGNGNLAILIGQSVNPKATLYHEVIHAMRNMNLFTAQEWAALSDAAKGWMEKHDIAARYPNLTPQEQIEEAIAEEFAAWAAAPKSATGLVMSAFAKIKRMLLAIRNALKGLGYQTAEDVFGKAMAGEIGARNAGNTGAVEKNQMRMRSDARWEKAQKSTDDMVSDLIGEEVTSAVMPAMPISMRKETFLRTAMNQPVDAAFRIPFMAVGGLDQIGRWKYGMAAEKSIRNVIVSGDAGFMSPLVERVRHGMIDRYGLPADYVQRERRRSLDEALISAEGQEHLESIMAHDMSPEESAVLQAVLTGEAVADADMAKVAAPIRKAIDDMGAEAVELGLISAESYERNRGKYLNRVYAKHESNLGTVAKFAEAFGSGRRKKIVGNQFKGRGIFEEVSPERVFNDNREFLSASRGKPQKGDKIIILDLRSTDGTAPLPGMVQPAGRIRKRVYWPADVKIPESLNNYDNRGTFEVRGERAGNLVLWRDFSKSERTKMGEILDARYTVAKTFAIMAQDLANGRFFKDIALNEDWSRADAPPDAQVDDDPQTNGWLKRMWVDPHLEWIKVPATKITKSNTFKYGALAGRYVRADIWRDMAELESLQTPGWWRNLLTQWKMMKTARNPVTHMNNVMSNVMFMDMADVRSGDLLSGAMSFFKGDAIYQEAANAGAFGADMVTNELRENILRPMLDQIRKDMLQSKGGFEAEVGRVGKLMDMITKAVSAGYTGLKAADRLMLNAYSVEDQVFRMALYVRRRNQGMGAVEAANEAREQFLDYDIRAPWVNAARKSVLPFISYTYRAVPKIAQTIAERPWKIAKYVAIYQALNAMAYALAPSDWDEDEERKSLREAEQGYTWVGSERLVRMPWLDQYENPVFLDVRRWIPAGDVFDTGGNDIPPWLAIGGPLMIGLEMYMNKSAFTGDEIYNPITDSFAERMKARAAFLYRGFMPNAPWVPGSYSYDNIVRAANGDALQWGSNTPYDLGSALLSSVGIKLQPKDVTVGYQSWAMEYDRIDRELDMQASALRRQRRLNRIDDDGFASGMAAINEKRAVLSQEIQGRFPQ